MVTLGGHENGVCVLGLPDGKVTREREHFCSTVDAHLYVAMCVCPYRDTPKDRNERREREGERETARQTIERQTVRQPDSQICVTHKEKRQGGVGGARAEEGGREGRGGEGGWRKRTANRSLLLCSSEQIGHAVRSLRSQPNASALCL